jgi:uncharacterized membrane protein
MTPPVSQTSLGVTENVGGVLAYLFGWVSGLIILLLEQKNGFVRFHAMQSILLSVAIGMLSVALGYLPLFGWMSMIFLMPVAFILWIVLIVKAYNGERYKLPILGDLTEQLLTKQS